MNTLAKRICMTLAVLLITAIAIIFAVCTVLSGQPSDTDSIYKVEVPSNMRVEYISRNDTRYVYDSDNYIDVLLYRNASFDDVCKEYQSKWSLKEGYFSCENQFGSQLIDDMVYIYHDDSSYYQATCVPYKDGVLVLDAKSTFDERDESELDKETLDNIYEKTGAFEIIFNTIELVG